MPANSVGLEISTVAPGRARPSALFTVPVTLPSWMACAWTLLTAAPARRRTSGKRLFRFENFLVFLVMLDLAFGLTALRTRAALASEREFLAFIRFLGAIGESTALTVHDMIADAIGKTRLEDSLVFSISTGLWSVDLDEVLSRCIERLSAGLLEWVAERKAARLKNGRVNQ